MTSLHCAAKQNSVEMIRALLAANADLHVSSTRSVRGSRSVFSSRFSTAAREQTALHFAAVSRSCNAADLLLSARANVDGFNEVSGCSLLSHFLLRILKAP